jgi:hypothetical protein
MGLLKSRILIPKPRITAKHKGRNGGDPGADGWPGGGESWSKSETVFEKLWETFE